MPHHDSPPLWAVHLGPSGVRTLPSQFYLFSIPQSDSMPPHKGEKKILSPPPSVLEANANGYPPLYDSRVHGLTRLLGTSPPVVPPSLPPFPTSCLSSCPPVILGRLLAAGPARRGPKAITPCFVLHGWRSGPSPGFLLVLPSRLRTTWSITTSLSTTLQQPSNHGEFNTWSFSRSSLAVAERERAWPLDRTTSDCPPFRFETQLAGHSNLWPLCCLLSAMSDSTEILSLSVYLDLLSTSESDGQFSSPQRVFPLRDPLLVRLLQVLLSQYLPSRVSAPIRYGWYCGWWRCSKVPVSSSFFTWHERSPWSSYGDGYAHVWSWACLGWPCPLLSSSSWAFSLSSRWGLHRYA